MSDISNAFDATLLRGLFDRIYVINLATRVDRRKEMAVELAKVGLTFDDPLLELVSACRPEAAGGFPSIGARGCFLSHLDVLQRATTAGHDAILILEDDVDWTPTALSLGSDGADRLRDTPWQFLHGGLGNDRGSGGQGSLQLGRIAPDEVVGLTHFIGLRGAAISLARDDLSAILERPPGSPEGGPMHVDGAYFWFRRKNPDVFGVMCKPSLARQRSSKSDIAQSGIRSLPGISHLLELRRSMKKRFRR